MKRLILPLLVVATIAAWQAFAPSAPPDHATPRDAATAARPASPAGGADVYAVEVQRAFERRQSGVMLTAAGDVQRVLSDDREGSPHQRFIIRFPSGHTVLVAHNIDLAPRIAGLEVGDTVRLRGQYEWNEKGGVIHWTHRDTRGKREGGWVRHEGTVYR